MGETSQGRATEPDGEMASFGKFATITVSLVVLVLLAIVMNDRGCGSPAFYCYTDGEYGACFRADFDCSVERDHAFKAGLSVSRCNAASEAWCYDASGAEHCLTTQSQCRSLRQYDKDATGCEERR